MNELIMPFAVLIIGSLVGYGYGLSLVNQGRVLSSFSFLPFIRMPLTALLAFYLLHWSTIAFILFGGSLLVTMWATLLTTKHVP